MESYVRIFTQENAVLLYFRYFIFLLSVLSFNDARKQYRYYSSESLASFVIVRQLFTYWLTRDQRLIHNLLRLLAKCFVIKFYENMKFILSYDIIFQEFLVSTYLTRWPFTDMSNKYEMQILMLLIKRLRWIGNTKYIQLSL